MADLIDWGAGLAAGLIQGVSRLEEVDHLEEISSGLFCSPQFFRFNLETARIDCCGIRIVVAIDHLSSGTTKNRIVLANPEEWQLLRDIPNIPHTPTYQASLVNLLWQLSATKDTIRSNYESWSDYGNNWPSSEVKACSALIHGGALSARIATIAFGSDLSSNPDMPRWTELCPPQPADPASIQVAAGVALEQVQQLKRQGFDYNNRLECYSALANHKERQRALEKADKLLQPPPPGPSSNSSWML